MHTSTTPSSLRSARREATLRHLPPAARAALDQFEIDGDQAALDAVVFAILADFSPQRPPTSLVDLPGDTRLIDDLGFDSLAITEVVFAAEDLFRISISNAEIVLVRSLDDLRGFIHAKVAGRSAD
jgi:acyl carrier protein